MKKPLFNIITKSLKFEAEENQQNGNDISNGDQELDAQLDQLKSGEDGNDKSNSDSGDSGSLDGEEDNPTSDGQTGEADLSSQDDLSSGSGTDDSLSSSVDENGEEAQDQSSTNRKLTLYAEFGRLQNVLKESIDAVDTNTIEDTTIKGGIAQLDDVLRDVKFIMSSFDTRDEADIMLQFQLIKERTSTILELLHRRNRELRDSAQNTK